MARGITISTAVLAVIALVAVGVIVGVFIFPAPSPGPTAVGGGGTIKVSSENYDGSHQVGASPALASAQAIHAPQTGIVTSSSCRAGQSISSGGLVLTVNDQPVIALSTTSPLWRDLAAGMKGPDVTALQKELTRLGHTVTASGTYDAATAQAVAALFAAQGLAATPDGGLPLASVLWLPASKVDVAACSFRVGDSVTAGQEIAQLAGALQSLTLLNPPSGPGWVARMGKISVPVDSTGRITDKAFLDAVEADPTFKALQSRSSAAAESGADGDVEGSGGSEQSSVPVVLALKKAETVVVVPPSAVVVKEAGQGCLVSDGHTVTVSIISSSLGQTMVKVPDGVSLTRVLRTPPATLTCR